MSAAQGYLVPRGPGEASFTERRSRFIGRIFPISAEPEAMSLLQDMRRTYWDANHNVYAYTLREGGLMRYSDDGEPQGTAGRPVLDVLRGAGAYNLLCVVTRYFGGVLLGTGGLTRAYARAAKEALDAAGLAEVRPWTRVSLTFPYHLLASIRRRVAALEGEEIRIDYSEHVLMELWLLSACAQGFFEDVTELSGAAVQPILGEEVFR